MIDVLNNVQAINLDEDKPRKRPTLSSSSSNSTRAFQVEENKVGNKLLKDYYENDDEEDIVVVDGDSDLEKAESQDENDFEDNFEHDDDDDVEYGQKRGLKEADLIKDNLENLDNEESDPNSLEIQLLEKFK